MTKAQELLLAFYKAWLSDSISEYPSRGIRRAGLCFNLGSCIERSMFRYLLKPGHYPVISAEDYDAAVKEMRVQFDKDPIYPFGRRLERQQHHRNPLRIEFVHKEIQRLEAL